MKRAVKYGMTALLAAVLITTAGCSKGDENAYADANPQHTNNLNVGKSIYEGEWSVNKQVVDTARMELNANGEIQLRLPESYLLGLCFPEATNEVVKPSNVPSLVKVYQQGFSDTSQYMSLDPEMTQNANAERIFVNCSFLASVGRTPYSIHLLSKELATAIIQNATGQWTLSIPIDGFVLTNLYLSSTDESETVELPHTVTIYYNTKRRIE